MRSRNEMMQPADAGPVERPVRPLADEAQPLVERAVFEAWFLARYSYTRAVLTNPIWASEIKAAAEAFGAGLAAERERCAQMCENVAFEHREGSQGRVAAMRAAAVVRGPNYQR